MKFDEWCRVCALIFFVSAINVVGCSITTPSTLFFINFPVVEWPTEKVDFVVNFWTLYNEIDVCLSIKVLYDLRVCDVNGSERFFCRAMFQIKMEKVFLFSIKKWEKINTKSSITAINEYLT